MQSELGDFDYPRHCVHVNSACYPHWEPVYVYVYRLPCSMVTAALLGAYAVQSELGDYDVREFGAGLDYLRQFEFCPQQSEQLLAKVHEIHKTLRFASSDSAWSTIFTQPSILAEVVYE